MDPEGLESDTKSFWMASGNSGQVAVGRSKQPCPAHSFTGCIMRTNGDRMIQDQFGNGRRTLAKVLSQVLKICLLLVLASQA
jgi:hypothetical protein